MIMPIFVLDCCGSAQHVMLLTFYWPKAYCIATQLFNCCKEDSLTQWANGGGGLQSPTSQHGGHQNRRTRQGLVWCIIIITHSHKCSHRLIWVGGIVFQKIAIYKALILSHFRREVEDSTLWGGGLGMFWFRRWRTAISDARLDRFIKIYFVCGRVFDWSWIIIFLTRHKYALTEATLWLQIICTFSHNFDEVCEYSYNLRQEVSISRRCR